jgi:hypothetical protein
MQNPGSRRVALVCASHCDSEGPLSGLAHVADSLSSLLRDSRRGDCRASQVHGIERTLMVDSSPEELRAAFLEAATVAVDQVLVLVWIGHGRWLDRRFYLMPQGAVVRDDRVYGALELLPLLSEIRQQCSDAGPSGLIVMLDACQSGTALRQALEEWAFTPAQAGVAMPLAFMSSTGGGPAYNLSFSRGLIELLEHGLGCEAALLDAGRALLERLQEVASQQTPQVALLLDAPGEVPLWISRNVAVRRSELARALGIEDAPRVSLPIQVITERIKETTANLFVTANAGAGKSTLAMMLLHLPKEMRKRFGRQHLIDAAYFVNESTKPYELIKSLSEQLELYEGFRRAALPFKQHKHLPAEESLLLNPLRTGGESSLTLLIDNLSSMGEAPRTQINRLLTKLTTLPGIRIIATARTDTEVPEGFELCELGRLTDVEVGHYLSECTVDQQLHTALTRRIGGNWLCAVVFARAVRELGLHDPQVIDELSLEGAFRILLDRLGIGSATPDQQNNSMTIVFMTLAAVGYGPAIPYSLLLSACQAQPEGPKDGTELEETLVKLRGFTSVASPGGIQHWGLFHQELVRYAAETHPDLMKLAHQTIVSVLETQVPDRRRAVSTAHWRYAFEQELNHRVAINLRSGLLDRLVAIASPDQRENLALMRRLQRVLAESFCLSADDRDVLRTRGNIAQFIGVNGDPRSALAHLQALLAEQAGTLGPDHQDVLGTRERIAGWTGVSVDARSALALYQALLPDQVRMLGADHPDVHATRGSIAGWTGVSGNAAEACALYQALLPDQVRMLGADHPEVHATRASIAGWTGVNGDAQAACALYLALFPDQVRILGADDPDVLTTRHHVASWTGESGDARSALALYQALLPDQTRILGPEHPDVLHTRGRIAYWMGESADAQAALAHFKSLLSEQVAILGPDHPEVLATRGYIASWTGKNGDTQGALALYKELLADQIRILGPDDSDVHATRRSIASWIGESGDAQGALALYKELLADQMRIRGPGDPDVLRTRSHFAYWTGECGDARGALSLYQALLPDQARMLSPDHPDVLATREEILYRTSQQ